MRRALIGISTPIGYDYLNQASQAPGDLNHSPNPILDSPFGLLLLFDELYFLSRSLCPENMRDLPYVYFIDEKFPHLLPSDEELRNVRESAMVMHGKEPYEIYTGLKFISLVPSLEVIQHMDIKPMMSVFSVGKFCGYANTEHITFAIDLLFLSKLSELKVELITNSKLKYHCKEYESPRNTSQLTEVFLLDNIPNYLSIEGPYHPIVEKIRNNNNLVHFRNWVSQNDEHRSIVEMKEAKEQVEASIKDAQEKYFVKYLNQENHFVSIAKGVVGDVIGIAFPALGTSLATINAAKSLLRNTDKRWQAFLVSSKNELKSIAWR